MQVYFCFVSTFLLRDRYLLVYHNSHHISRDEVLDYYYFIHYVVTTMSPMMGHLFTVLPRYHTLIEKTVPEEFQGFSLLLARAR